MSDRIEELMAGLRVFLKPGQVTNLRAFNREREPIHSGLYRDMKVMVHKALELEALETTTGVYFVPNPIKEDRLPANQPWARGSVNKDGIRRRSWLLIDADPTRFDAEGKALAGEAANVPSTEDERAAAWDVISGCREVMHGAGMQSCALGDSSNGWHLSYPIDLPNDDATYEQIAFFLAELEDRFGNDRCHIDQKPKDAPRIWKLYGTVARKGMESPGRPWRTSQLIEWSEATDEVRQANNTALERLLASWRLQRELIDRQKERARAASQAIRTDAMVQARAYISKEDIAVSGQGGHKRAFHVACIAVLGFDLTKDEAYDVLQDWSGRCNPPWSEKELRHKIDDADKEPCPQGRGYLLRQAKEKAGTATSKKTTKQPASLVTFDPLPGEEDKEEAEENKERTADDICTIHDLKESGAKVSWLWLGWIQSGVLTALAAEGGTGKTRWCADLVRRIRHGLPWPDGQPMTLPPDSTVLWVVADNHHDEMVTLAETFGIADVLRINAWREDPYGGVSLDTPEDYQLLDRRIRLLQPALVIIDTVGNATDKNLSKQEDAKAFYQPLQVICRRNRTAILCLTHLNATGRFLGRRVLEKVRVAIKMEQPDKEDPRRSLEIVKSNSKRPNPLGVSMGDAGNEYDNDPPKAPAEGEDEPGQQRAKRGRGRPPVACHEAEKWLREWLALGPRPVGNTRNEAEKQGFSAGVLYRAKDAIGAVESEAQGRKYWELTDEL